MLKKVLLLSILVPFPSLFSMVRLASPIIRPSSAVMNPETEQVGRLVMISGPMACGKSDEIMRIITILNHAKCKTLVCKHSFDTRSAKFLTSRRRAEEPIEAYLISDPKEILAHVEHSPVNYVAIDEVQFFKENPMVDVVQKLIKRGVSVIASGLDKDFKGDPFGKYSPEPLCMPSLLAIADECTKLKAICEVCKRWEATMTQRLVNGKPAHRNDPLVMVDDGTKQEITYEPRCRECHELPN